LNISYLQKSEWPKLKKFIKNYISNNIIEKKIFTKYWFLKDNKNWQIQIAKNELNQIESINFFIKNKVKFFKKNINAVFTSLAYSKFDKRKKGTIGKILFLLHRKHNLVFSLCGNENSLPINNLLGKKIPNLSFDRFIYVHSNKCFRIIKKKYHHKIKLNFKNIKNNNNIDIFETSTIPKNIDNLWKKFSLDIDICIIKNYNYLVWRYVKCPFQNYQFFIFKNNNNLLGLIVIKFQNTPYGKCARIVDIIVDKKYLESILGKMLLECSNRNVLYTDFFHVGKIYESYFIKSGFKYCTSKNYLNKIPNLLSPIDAREWTNSFHIGGILIHDKKVKLNSNRIWFTKGDGDRDWPTLNDI
jgi:hypothetical protein